MSNITKKKLKIEGMHCSSCAMNIDFEGEDLEGVRKIQTSYAKQECSVEFDSEKIKIKQIIESIAKIGYKAFEIE
jgi:Cu+-exporting ATPase